MMRTLRSPGRRRPTRWLVPVLGVTIVAGLAAQSPAPPHLRRQAGVTELVVDGRPFLIRGGELGNSSASNLEYLAPHWSRFRALRLNTILAPIYWDLLEPEEGRFDFTLVDGLVENARKHEIKLVLLWFGSWKNSMSCYAPAWVKKDQADSRAASMPAVAASRFSLHSRRPTPTVNARAFAALMKHLRAIDGGHTVLMVQVENEIGMIPEAAVNALYAFAEHDALGFAVCHRSRSASRARRSWPRAMT
jgi:beta-galactosidase GanA